MQFPGRGERMLETPYTKVSPLVEAMAIAMRDYLDKPFAFFGHSLGAVVGYELARHLQKEYGLQPRQLFVSGRRAPHVPNHEPPTYDLPQDEFIEELRRLNGTPKEVLEQPELLHMILPLLRADFEMVQTYSYMEGPPLTCPIMGFAGMQDEEVDVEDVNAWQAHTSASFRLQKLPGGHFFLHTAQSLLLQILSQRLVEIVRQSE